MPVIKSIERVVHQLLETTSPNQQNKLHKWAREIVAAFFNLINSLIVAISGLLDAIWKIPIWLLGGLRQKNSIIQYQLINTLGSSVVGGMISVFGHLLYCIGIIVRVLNSGRTLNENEKQIISEVFQNSINSEIIRLIELPFWSNHCFVLHNYIFIPHNVTSISNSLLVHEVVHIWQFRQEGCSYIFNALAAQIRYGRKNIPGNAYDWTAEIQRGKTDWQDFNKEAAAQFIEDLWKEGAACIYTNKGNCEIIEEGNGVFFRIMHEGTSISNIASPIMISKRDSQNYSAIAFRAVNQLQSMKSWFMIA